MPFWPVVLVSLIGIPIVLFVTGMGMIFAAAGLAGGPQASRARTIVVGWLACAWVLAAASGAFGLVPMWRAWHGGDENFDGGLRLFVDWLVGVGVFGALVAAVVGAQAAARSRPANQAPLRGLARGLLLALVFAPWGAIVAWLAWPLVLWPLRGTFRWPDAATGWTHTGEVTAILVAAALVEEAVRRLRKR